MHKDNLMKRISYKARAVFVSICVSIIFVPFAQADWKNDIGTFRIGVVGGSDPSSVLAKLEPFRLALEEKLGVSVNVLPSPNLRSLMRSHIEGRNEYAIVSASAYAAGWAKCECIEPLVAAKSSDGSSGIHSIIVTRKGNGITAPKDLLGKKIITLGANSTLGYSFPIHQLQLNKIDLLSGGTQLEFPETGEEALRLFASGEGDALFGWSSKMGDPDIGYSRGVLNQLAGLLPNGLGSTEVIWTSSKVPHRVHSIRKSLAGEPKRLLKEVLSTLFEKDPIAFDAIEPEFGGGFEIISQSDFRDLVVFAKSVLPEKIEVVEESMPVKEGVTE